MCGRFGLFAELGDLAGHFDFRAEPLHGSYLPRWNIPPTSPVLTILREGDTRAASMMRWGLTPSRSRNSKSAPRLLFNARAETIDQRPIFRNAFAGRRCLVPANGFYEWQAGTGRTKTPQWVSHRDGDPVAFAGIWYGAQPDEEDQGACVIVTTAANALVAPIHSRMPVILPPEHLTHGSPTGLNPTPCWQCWAAAIGRIYRCARFRRRLTGLLTTGRISSTPMSRRRRNRAYSSSAICRRLINADQSFPTSAASATSSCSDSSSGSSATGSGGCSGRSMVISVNSPGSESTRISPP